MFALTEVAVEYTSCLHACLLLCSSYINIGNGLEQWRASIGLFNRKCIIKQRVRVKVSWLLFFITCLIDLFSIQKWHVNSTCKLLSFVFNDIVYNLYFKVVLILILLEAGAIEINPGPYTSNNSLSILHSNIRSIHNN